jgi:glycine betaine/proline transport system ATP-binding protein
VIRGATSLPRSGAEVQVQGLWKVFGLPASVEAQVRARAPEREPHASEFAAHPGALAAVADVSFTLAPGEVFCIMGLSGSGKSTLVRLVNRLIEPTRGSIVVDGMRMTELSPAELRKARSEHMAMVFQNVALFPHKTIFENIAYPLEVRGVQRAERLNKATELLDLVRLTGWGERIPAQLSGGMQQRVGIARALAAAPKLLLMDEPFSALDPLIRRELQDEFLDIVGQTGATTIFITHDFDEAVYLGDRIAIMRAGRFEQVGAPRDIVFAPANDYVARFISVEAVLASCRARDVMRPITANGPITGTAAAGTCAPGVRVIDLLPLLGRGGRELHVEVDGATVGVVSQQSVVERLGDILARHQAATAPAGTAPV